MKWILGVNVLISILMVVFSWQNVTRLSTLNDELSSCKTLTTWYGDALDKSYKREDELKENIKGLR